MLSKTRLVMYTLLVASFQPTMWRICIELASSPPRVDVLAGKAVDRVQGLAENPVLVEGHGSPLAGVAVDDGHVGIGKIHGDQQLARRLVGLGGNHKAQRGKGGGEELSSW